MPTCPSCQHELEQVASEGGPIHVCANCGGRMVSTSVLRNEHAQHAFILDLIRTANTQSVPADQLCPHCRKPMVEILVNRQKPLPLRLEMCRGCSSVWFNQGEIARVPKEVPKTPPNRRQPSPQQGGHNVLAEASQYVIEQRVKATAKREAEELDAATEHGPREGWKYLPAALGIPVELANQARTRRPWATWILSVVIVICYSLSTINFKPIIMSLGFIPEHWSRAGGLTIITCLFLHAGLVHLLSNLYFLIVFGDNAEERLGTLRYLALLLGAQIVAVFIHMMIEPRSNVPLIGASGAISGVLAYYAIAFPNAKLGVYIGYIIPMKWVSFPAAVGFAFWLVLQLFGASLQANGLSNVSAGGHLGGAFIGMVVGIVERVRPTRQPAASPSPVRLKPPSSGR